MGDAPDSPSPLKDQSPAEDDNSGTGYSCFEEVKSYATLSTLQWLAFAALVGLMYSPVARNRVIPTKLTGGCDSGFLVMTALFCMVAIPAWYRIQNPVAPEVFRVRAGSRGFKPRAQPPPVATQPRRPVKHTKLTPLIDRLYNRDNRSKPKPRK